MSYCEEEDRLVDEQAGFRKGRACVDQIFILQLVARKGKRTFSCFVDVRKAYDRVWRDGMWTSLWTARDWGWESVWTATTLAVLLYVDDLVLVADSEADLQRMMNEVYAWYKKWRVELCMEKTKVVVFGKRGVGDTSIRSATWQ